MPAHVLIVDDEPNICRTLDMVLSGAGFQTSTASSAEDALARLALLDIDVIILDVRLPKMNGIDALRQIKGNPDTQHIPVLMASGHASINDAVEAIQLGAIDFFEKPLDRDRVLVSVRNAITASQLKQEVERLRADVAKRFEMIGESPLIRELFDQIDKVAPTAGRVLITGESGTGKELIARAVHRLSPRRDKAFIKVNCAAIPAELIESELFGYERGAFTGAQGRKKGMFELANEGTLFLDEIGDMSPSAQAKVLRALQSGEINRVGGEKAISVDVRVIAATNKDLENEVKEGRFREDLFFRLNVLPIYSPPLRERAQDIPLLARAFLTHFCRDNGLPEKPIDADVLEQLTSRNWPGNVRELQNVVERMAILSGDRITLANLPAAGRLEQARQSDPPPSATTSNDESFSLGIDANAKLTLREVRQQTERAYILKTLQAVDWNISKAAAQLGLERTNLHKKIKAYGIDKDGLEA